MQEDFLSILHGPGSVLDAVEPQQQHKYMTYPLPPEYYLTCIGGPRQSFMKRLENRTWLYRIEPLALLTF